MRTAPFASCVSSATGIPNYFSVTASSRRRRQELKNAPDFSSIDDIGRQSERHFGSERFPERLRFLRLDHAWGVAVGAHVRAVTRPALGTADSLVVEVRDAKWKKELDRLKPEILARLNRQIPSSPVSDITFRVRKTAGADWRAEPVGGSLPSTATNRPGRPETAVPSEASSSLHDVTDDALRERLSRVMVRYLARTAS